MQTSRVRKESETVRSVPFRQRDILEISKKTTTSGGSITELSEKVYKEFMLYAIGRNINKYHRFLHDKIPKFEEKNTDLYGRFVF